MDIPVFIQLATINEISSPSTTNTLIMVFLTDPVTRKSMLPWGRLLLHSFNIASSIINTGHGLKAVIAVQYCD